MKAHFKTIDNEEYHKTEGLSFSKLKLLLDPSCPKNFWWHHIMGQDNEPTKAMLEGTEFHTHMFEPQEFDKRYYTVPEGLDMRMSSNAGKANVAAQKIIAGSRLTIEKDRVIELNHMKESLLKIPSVPVLMGDGVEEQAAFWIDEDTGLLCKTKPDWRNDFGLQLLDGKTAQDASPDGFSRVIDTMKYHMQLAMQVDGIKAVTGKDYTAYFLAVEKKAPYCAAVYKLADADLEIGRQLYKSALRIYIACKASNFWPSYSELELGSMGIKEISRPYYAQNRDYMMEDAL